MSTTDGKRPDGKTLYPFKEGKELVWDYCCNDTFASSYLSATSREAGKAAEEGEKRKIQKYAFLSQNYIFTPVAIETLGPMGPETFKFIQNIGSKISNITGDKLSTSRLMQSISVAIQRGNADSVLGTSRGHKKYDELFYL